MLIHGLQYSNFLLFWLFYSQPYELIYAWALHTLSFLTFALSVSSHEEEEGVDAVGLLLRRIFLANLIFNSLFILGATLLLGFLTLVTAFCPGFRDPWNFLDRFQHFLAEDFNMDRNPLHEPLTSVELRELKSCVFEDEEGDRTCVICFEEKSTARKIIKSPHCKHTFHAECLRLWLQKRPFCPLCRVNFRSLASVVV